MASLNEQEEERIKGSKIRNLRSLHLSAPGVHLGSELYSTLKSILAELDTQDTVQSPKILRQDMLEDQEKE